MNSFTKRVLKYGGFAAAGATAGAFAGGFISAPPGERVMGGVQSAVTVGAVSTAAVGALAGRRYIKRAAYGAVAALHAGPGKIAFRRIHGRIVPIRVK